MVTANFSGGNFTVYENGGSGNFINRNDLRSNSAGSCVVLHDRDNDGCMDMTGIDELEDFLILFTNDGAVNVKSDESIPDDFILYQNYPNPFNPTTRISWQSAVSGWQTIKVFDILGDEITTLVDDYLSEGKHEIEFSAEKLSTGIYFYTLQAEGKVQTRKMFLLK